MDRRGRRSLQFVIFLMRGAQRSAFLSVCLSFLHPLPIYKSVDVVEKESDKADNDRDIACVMHARQHPQNDENDIVCGIREGVKRRAAKGQIYGEKAGGYRYRAWNEVRRVEICENEIEDHRNKNRKRPYQQVLLLADSVDLYLGLVVFVGMSKPGDQREHRHRHRHSEIGRHLSVVGKAVGDSAVDKTEDNHKHLTDRITLGAKDECCDTDKRGNERHIASSVKDKE